jgi:tRNA modification GTPase
MSLPHLDDTVAAVATAPGRGAIAVIRLSGRAALEILQRVCLPATPAIPPRVQRLCRLHHPETGELIETGLVTFFPGPSSFTGEDTVEIATHGGLVAPQRVLDALLAAGAREALPGEFTRRAVANGKMDLLQAEAIGDLIDARSPAFHRAAVHQMERGLSSRIERLRSELLRVEALLSYGIDFPDEDEPPVGDAVILEAAEAIARQLDLILQTAPQGEMLRRGAMVVLAGLPNSGKSSLFNALLGVERAIVTEIPGTTRDAVEADATLGGYPFRLVDTAGLRPTTDRIEAIGIEVAHRYLGAADLIVFCSDATTPITAEELAFLRDRDPARALLVRTKADLLESRPSGRSAEPSDLLVSVRSGEGMPGLLRGLLRAAFGLDPADPPPLPLVTSERQLRAIRNAGAEIQRFAATLADGVPHEFAASHLRSAVEALEELIGVVTPDDVLATLFSRFCVGK